MSFKKQDIYKALETITAPGEGKSLIENKNVTNVVTFGNEVLIDVVINNPTLQAKKKIEKGFEKAQYAYNQLDNELRRLHPQDLYINSKELEKEARDLAESLISELEMVGLLAVELFLDKEGNVIPGKSTVGGLAVGIPGAVAGILEVHRKLGSLPLAELIQSAIALAENGYVVSAKQEKSYNRYSKQFTAVNGKVTLYAKGFKEGDVVKNIPHCVKKVARLSMCKNPFWL